MPQMDGTYVVRRMDSLGEDYGISFPLAIVSAKMADNVGVYAALQRERGSLPTMINKNDSDFGNKVISFAERAISALRQ